jgi:hypothetical protein
MITLVASLLRTAKRVPMILVIIARLKAGRWLDWRFNGLVGQIVRREVSRRLATLLGDNSRG